MTQIVLADGNELVREGIAALLENLPGCHVAGQYSDPRSLVNALENLSSGVVLLDSKFAGIRSVDLVRSIARLNPNIRVVLICTEPNEVSPRELIEAGVAACVLKCDSVRDLSRSVRISAPNKLYVSRSVANAFRKKAPINGQQVRDPHAELTRREKQILRLVGEGYSSKEIAMTLNIGTATVKTHRDHLMDKLNVRGIAGLTRESIRLRLVDLENRPSLGA